MLFFLKPAQVAGVTYNKSGFVTAGSLTRAVDVYESAETGTATATARLPGADAHEAARPGTATTGALLAGVRGTAETQKTGTVAAATWVAALGNQKHRTGAVAAGTNLAGADQYTASETGKVLTAARLSGFFRPAPGPGGKFVITNAYVLIAGVDVSRLCSHVEVVMERDEIDVTPLGSPYKITMDGPGTGHFTITMFADPTVISPSFIALMNSPVAVEVHPRGQQVTATNPAWTATAVAVKQVPLTGSVGEAATATIELKATTEILETV